MACHHHAVYVLIALYPLSSARLLLPNINRVAELVNYGHTSHACNSPIFPLMNRLPRLHLTYVLPSQNRRQLCSQVFVTEVPVTMSEYAYARCCEMGIFWLVELLTGRQVVLSFYIPDKPG